MHFLLCVWQFGTCKNFWSKLMAVVNFGQYLSILAILWGGLLLLSRIKREFFATKIPHLSVVLEFLCKIVKWLAIFSTGALLTCFFDVKGALSIVRESIGCEIELFLRELIDVLFNTRSFFAVFQILVNGVVVLSTTFCSAALLLGNLAYLCFVILKHASRATKVFAKQTISAQAYTTNAYNFQRKYFIRA